MGVKAIHNIYSISTANVFEQYVKPAVPAVTFSLYNKFYELSDICLVFSVFQDIKTNCIYSSVGYMKNYMNYDYQEVWFYTL